MSTAAAKYSNIGTKFKVGTAACAIAGAAVLTPGAVAYAGPAAPVPTVGIGSSISAPCDEAGSDDCLSPGASARAGGSANISAADGPFQNPLIRFGPIPNPPPATIFLVEFNVINALPNFLRVPLQGWFAQVIPNGVEGCILGATARVDKYGTVGLGITRGCG